MLSISYEQNTSSYSFDVCERPSASSPIHIASSTPNSNYKPRVNFHSVESLISPTVTPLSSPRQNSDSGSYQRSNQRKPRRKFSDWQNWCLCQVYEQNRYPSSPEIEEIASQLFLPIASIRIWFQNHRARYGKNIGK